MLNMNRIGSIVTTIIGGTLALLLIAKLLPVFFPAVADVNEYLTNETTTTGDGTADALMPTFAIVVGILALLVAVGWVLKGFGVDFAGAVGRFRQKRGYRGGR